MCTGQQRADCITYVLFCAFWSSSEDFRIDGEIMFVFFTAPACQGNLLLQLPQEVLVCPVAKEEKQG